MIEKLKLVAVGPDADRAPTDVELMDKINELVDEVMVLHDYAMADLGRRHKEMKPQRTRLDGIKASYPDYATRAACAVEVVNADDMHLLIRCAEIVARCVPMKNRNANEVSYLFVELENLARELMEEVQ